MRKRWIIALAAGIALVAGAGLFLKFNSSWKTAVRERVLAALGERFASKVELQQLDISLFPRLRIAGQGLVLRHHGRTDIPPLIQIKSFVVQGRLRELLGPGHFLRSAQIEGLHITVPPRDHRVDGGPKRPPQHRYGFSIAIGEVTSADSELDMLSRKPAHPPLIFLLHRIKLESVSSDGPAHFHALLTNPKPVGEIDSEGDFGPWAAEEPSQTPVKGTFRFSNADLGTIHGLGGILASQGQYDGVLDNLAVHGETDTPDFEVAVSGHPVALHTTYDATVDGANGDTILNRVEARFLHSVLVAKGGVTGTTGRPGRTINLQVTSTTARVDDLLRLAVKGNEPAMTGSASLGTRLEVAPGEQDIADRLVLNGRFGIGAAKFTKFMVQKKVEALSARGQGKPKQVDTEDPSTVVSSLRGVFTLRDGVVRFSDLAFDVTGASVQLHGSYNLHSEALDFHGELRMQAKLSQTVTGAKSFFLKAVDPFFSKKGAGTVLPIKITGNRNSPQFGLELHR